MNSIRKTSGKLAKVEEVKKQTKTKRKITEMEKQVFAHTEKEFDGNALGNLAAIAGGAKASDQISNIKENLLAERKIDFLEKSLKEKQVKWKQVISSFKSKKELDQLQEQLKNLKIDKKKPWKSLKKINKLSKQVKEKIAFYKDESKNLKSDVALFKNGISEIDLLIKKDLENLQKMFNLPEINPKDFASKLFGKILQQKFSTIYKYAIIAREYLPSKNSKSDSGTESISSPKERGTGKSFKFQKSGGYPLLWIKKLSISSKASNNSSLGNLDGTIIDITNAPSFLNKILKIQIAGDFPKQKIHGIQLLVNIDHTKEIAKEDVTVSVKQFPVQTLTFVNSKKLKFGINKATSRWKAKAIFQQDNIDFRIDTKFSSIDYITFSSTKFVEDVFSSAAKQTPVLKMSARAVGKLEALDWNINSNIAQGIANGFKGQIQSKINAQKLKLKNMINIRIGNKRKALDQNYKKVKSTLDNILNIHKGELSNIENLTLNKLKSSSVKKILPKKILKKKKLKKLFKKFKF